MMLSKKIILASKTEVKNALDLEDKNRKKKEKLQTFDSRFFHGKSCFRDNGTQDYLVFQPVLKYFKTSGNGNRIIA